jgi:hypothetical protein
VSEHDDELDEPFRDPLPQDDRLWRHPSEIDDEGQKRRSRWSWLRRASEN